MQPLPYQTEHTTLPQSIKDAQAHSESRFLHLLRARRLDLEFRRGHDAPLLVHEVDTEELWYWTGFRWKQLTDSSSPIEIVIQPGQTRVADSINKTEFKSASYRIILEGGGVFKMLNLDAVNLGSYPGDMVSQKGQMAVDLNTNFSAGFFELSAHNREAYSVTFRATRII